MTNINFVKISWQQFEKDCIVLSNKLKTLKIDKIVAISRGGLVVARILSDLLNISISHITISSYEDLKQQKIPRISETPSANFDNQTILIADEVSDTGHTFKRALAYFDNFSIKKIYTLAPYIKPKTTFIPDFYYSSIDAWIIFPYELKETADAFVKMFQDKEHAKKKLKEVGFEDWEIDAII